MFLQILLASTTADILQSLNVIILDHEKVNLIGKSDPVDVIQKMSDTTLSLPTGELSGNKFEFNKIKTITVGNIETLEGNAEIGGNQSTVGCIIAYPQNKPIKGFVIHAYGGGVDSGYSELSPPEDATTSEITELIKKKTDNMFTDGFGHVFCRCRDVRRVKENRHKDFEHQYYYDSLFMQEIGTDVLKIQKYVAEKASTFQGIQLSPNWSCVFEGGSFGGKLGAYIANNPDNHFDGFIWQVPGIESFRLGISIKEIVEKLNTPIYMNVALLDDRIYKGLILEWYDAMKEAGKLNLLTIRTFPSLGHFEMPLVSDTKPFLDYIDELKNNPEKATIKTKWNEDVTTYLYERLKTGMTFKLGSFNVLDNPYQLKNPVIGTQESFSGESLYRIDIKFIEEHLSTIKAVEQFLYPEISEEDIQESSKMWEQKEGFDRAEISLSTDPNLIARRQKLRKPFTVAYFIVDRAKSIKLKIREKKIKTYFDNDEELKDRITALSEELYPNISTKNWNIQNMIETVDKNKSITAFDDLQRLVIFVFAFQELIKDLKSTREYIHHLLKNNQAKLFSAVKLTSPEQLPQLIKWGTLLFPNIKEDRLTKKFTEWYNQIHLMLIESQLSTLSKVMTDPNTKELAENFLITALTFQELHLQKKICSGLMMTTQLLKPHPEKLVRLKELAHILAPESQESIDVFLNYIANIGQPNNELPELLKQPIEEITKVVIPANIALGSLYGDFNIKLFIEKQFDDYEAEIAAVKKAIAEKPELKEGRRNMWLSLTKGAQQLDTLKETINQKSVKQ